MELFNGIIQDKSIYGIPFTVDLIPNEHKNARTGLVMVPKFLTVHNTGNNNKAANAWMHTEYVDNLTEKYISWHFTVDDKRIFQEVPVNEAAWHAGDGLNGIGNRESVGIEICEHDGIDWQKAKCNAVMLILYLKQHIPTLVKDCVVPHQKWSGKYCPHRILDEGWDLFLELIVKWGGRVNATWEEIIIKAASNPDEWKAAIRVAVNAAKADGDLGPLEIFQFLPELLVKIYNLNK